VRFPGKTAYALLLLASAQASAQDRMEQVVVTATQRADSLLELPLSVSVIREEDLDFVRHVHANEVFQRAAGAWISRGNGQESLTALRSPVLTGAGSCGAFFMAGDGISLRAPGFCNVNQIFDANTEQAERIEVLKGPGTALYGSGAMHGLINVLTPRTTEETVRLFGAEAGPHGYLRGRYRFSGTRGGHGFLFAANLAGDGGYKRSSGFEQGKTSLRHTYDAGAFAADTIFTAATLDQDTAGFIEGYKAYEDADRKRENPNPAAYREAQSLRLQSRFSVPLGDDDTLFISPYWRDNDMEFLQHFLPWQSTERNGQRSFGINGKLYREAGRVELVAGLDMDRTDAWLKETQDRPFGPNQPRGTHYDYRVEALTAALFSQARWNFARRWNLGGGLRYEYAEYDYDNRTGDGPACGPEASNCRFYRPADRGDDFDNLSLNFGLLYDYLPAHAAYLRLSRGFRAPQAAELYRLQAGQETADLDSEELDSAELGFRGGAGSIRYELAGYYMEKDKVIFQDADRRNVSGAATLHYGLDLSVRWRILESLELALDGTLARHEYEGDIDLLGSSGAIGGNRVDTSPEHFGSLRLSWDFLPRYRAELEWVRMDGYYLEPDNRHGYDGHDLFNVRIGGQLTARLHAGLRITNLTDEDYAERADFGFGSYRYFVGEERAVYGHIEYRLGPD